MVDSSQRGGLALNWAPQEGKTSAKSPEELGGRCELPSLNFHT